MEKAAVRLSNAEVTHRVRTARLLTTLPTCAAALAASVAAVRTITAISRRMVSTSRLAASSRLFAASIFA